MIQPCRQPARAWGPRRCWCERKRCTSRKRQEDFPFSVWISGAAAVPCQRCIFGGAVLATWMHRQPPTQTRRILLQQQETIINDEASGPGRKHTSAVDGGSVQKQKMLLYLGKRVHLCRLEGQQGRTGWFVGACWAVPPLAPADCSVQVFKGTFGAEGRSENRWFGSCDVWRLSSLSHMCSSDDLGRSHVLFPSAAASTCLFQWRTGSETKRRKLWSLSASGKRWVGARKRAIGASPSVSRPSQDSPLWCAFRRENVSSVDLSAIRLPAPTHPVWPQVSTKNETGAAKVSL